jgi:NACalpha-BTF3-like transcription factor
MQSIDEYEIKFLISQTQCTYEIARDALYNHDNDLLDAILCIINGCEICFPSVKPALDN